MSTSGIETAVMHSDEDDWMRGIWIVDVNIYDMDRGESDQMQ